MRIEKRGNEEYLIGGPAEVNDCDAVRDGETCNVHFEGQHIATCMPGEDGAEFIRVRWPIEKVPTATAPTIPFRPAEEIAREIVEVRGEPFTMWFGDRRESIVLIHRCADSAEGEALVLRVLARLIEQSRAEGAAAERGRSLEILRTGREEIERLSAIIDEAKDVIGARRDAHAVEPLVEACRRVVAEKEKRVKAARVEGIVEGLRQARRMLYAFPSISDELAPVAERLDRDIKKAVSSAATPADPMRSALDNLSAAVSEIEGVMRDTVGRSARTDVSERQPAQPCDLAGCIRALVQEYAGRWADTHDADELDSIDEIMKALRWAVLCAKRDRRAGVDAWISNLRAASAGRCGAMFAAAADELEAIVRECGARVDNGA